MFRISLKALFFLILLSSKLYAIDEKSTTLDTDTVKENMAKMLSIETKNDSENKNYDKTEQVDQYISSIKKRQKIEIPKDTVKIESKDKFQSNGVMSSEDLLDFGYRAFTNGNIEAALHYYKGSYAKDKTNQDAIFGLATSYQLLGQNNDAIKTYMDLLALNPGHYQATNNLMILVSGNSIKEAIKELKRINEKYPNNPFIMGQIGTMHSYVDEYEDAVFYLGRAVEIDSTNIMYLYNMAITLDKMQKYKDAYIYYENVVDKLNPKIQIDKQAIRQRMAYIRYKS